MITNPHRPQDIPALKRPPRPKKSASREKTSGGKKKEEKKLGFDHECDWKTAALKLAQCVVTTLLSKGKIGMGSGMVISKKNGKTRIERWDKDFIEALAFIGVEVVDKVDKPAPKHSPKKAPSSTPEPTSASTLTTARSRDLRSRPQNKKPKKGSP